MKIRPSQLKTCLIILGSGVVFVGLSLISPIINIVKGQFKIVDIVLPIILVVVSIVFSLVTYLRAYYYLDRTYFIQQFIIKKKLFYYNNISYIDDIRSRRSKTLVMYLNTGRQVILAMDKNCKLLFEVSSRCQNLLSRSEFLRKHPNVRL